MQSQRSTRKDQDLKKSTRRTTVKEKNAELHPELHPDVRLAREDVE